MELRKELENYNSYKAQIKSKEYTIKKLENEEVSLNGSNFKLNGDIRPKGYMSSNNENKVINNADKITKLKKEIEELKTKIEIIDTLLNTLNPFYKRILELRYKHNLSLEAIANDCERSSKSISRTISDCIKKLNKKV